MLLTLDETNMRFREGLWGILGERGGLMARMG